MYGAIQHVTEFVNKHSKADDSLLMLW